MMTLTFDFSGDYGYELSLEMQDNLKSCQSNEEASDLCLSITTNTKIMKNRFSKDSGNIVQFFSYNWYLMFTVYVKN